MAELTHENVREAIGERVQKFMKLYKEGDCAGVAALYSEDPVIMPPGFDIIRGKEGIQQVFETFRTMGIQELIFDIVEVDPITDHAVEMSRYKLIGPEGQVLDEGKYIVVWKREPDGWKLHRDIFNSSVPPK